MIYGTAVAGAYGIYQYFRVLPGMGRTLDAKSWQSDIWNSEANARSRLQHYECPTDISPVSGHRHSS